MLYKESEMLFYEVPAAIHNLKKWKYESHCNALTSTFSCLPDDRVFESTSRLKIVFKMYLNYQVFPA